VILLFPVLVWSAMRLEQHGAVTSLFLIAAISLWRTVDGRGSFQAETLGGRLMVMQLFLATAAITSLILGAGISEMKEAERKLREAERMAAISQMESGLAHQSRNALQRSQACLEMLSRNIQDRPAAVSLVTRIQDAQDQLHRLYDQVRSYSAPIQLQRESVCVEAIVHDAWIGLVGQRNGRNARLTYDPANASLFLQADSTRMGQVIREIIMNSIEACADPVEVVAAWCHTTLNGRPAFRISLRDNGPGMSDEQRRRVFEPFYTTKPRGLGLGMAIAQRIVDAHGGRISVSDFGPGAEIVITLPRGNV
jgi:signal transduction histidine kinase